MGVWRRWVRRMWQVVEGDLGGGVTGRDMDSIG